ncbi:aromatic amino acid lyase [Acrocarpospora catenulata]|uniref:aromatic amino acid lyase n=1 Tax=Acrocarpospora catenulata TaxID=2836182 RepID=UPI001BD9B911|nr:aromatic amino acid lyase [Acrocarpospora catenulata]
MTTEPPEFTLDGATLTCAQATAIGYGQARVSLGATDRAETAWRSARSLTGPVYGRTTGVGANKEVPVHDRGLDLLRSHAGGAGPLIAPEQATAMLAIRLNQLLAGGSGVDPALLPVLAEAVNSRAYPPIRKYGAIGTGDLTALATTALCLLGELPWSGPRFPLASADALPFLSSNALTLADAALATTALHDLLTGTITVAARSWQAVSASLEPLIAEGPTATTLTSLLPPITPARIQDPYGYRTFPQVHDAALNTLKSAQSTINAHMNAAGENPVIKDGRAWHNGNFHTGPIALQLDALRAALVQTATLSTARLATLMDPAHTGKHPFLAADEGGSGALILEYVACDALATLRQLATPVTLAGAVLSRGVEDHAGFATQAARACLAAREPYTVVLACELVAAERAPAAVQPADGNLAAELDLAVSRLTCARAGSAPE